MSLHVERHGTGPDLVLLHGWGLHAGAWAEVVPPLAARHRVHAIDLPGHGLSAGVAPAAFGACVDAVAELIPDGANVCGWSLGGLVTQHLAIRHPRKVRRAVLVSTTPCYVQRTDWKCAMNAQTLEAFARDLHANPEATLATFVRLNALGGAKGRDAIRAFTARLFERGVPSRAALTTTLGWLRDTDLRREAALLPRGTTVIHGARDMLAPVAAGRWLASMIVEGRWVEFADAAHLPFFTHREAFLAALESALG